jgi:hypothetical protein
LSFVPQGFTARYYANADWAEPHERSPEYPRSAFTRIDRTLQFDMPAGPHLPLFFFNDNTRFNYYQPEQPGRGELPFSIEWRGYLMPAAPADTTFVVRGRGLETSLLIDGQPVLHKSETDQRGQVILSLAAGPGTSSSAWPRRTDVPAPSSSQPSRSITGRRWAHRWSMRAGSPLSG